MGCSSNRMTPVYIVDAYVSLSPFNDDKKMVATKEILSTDSIAENDTVLIIKNKETNDIVNVVKYNEIAPLKIPQGYSAVTFNIPTYSTYGVR